MGQGQGPYNLHSFDAMNNPHAKRRFKSNAHPVGAGPMSGGGSVTNTQLQQHAYQNGTIPVLG